MDKWVQLSDRAENIVEKKREMACYKHFLLFPQCFQKLSVVDVSKCVIMEKRVNSLSVNLLQQEEWNVIYDKLEPVCGRICCPA